jgi:hypothetical protein
MLQIDTVCRTPPGQAAVSLRGDSGVLHGFTAFPLQEAPGGPAVYLYARPAGGIHEWVVHGWTLLGIGETGCIRRRPDLRFSRLVDGLALGATHLLVHFCYRETSQRLLIVEDLMEALRLTPCRALIASQAA